jgi:hypothetical protein
VQRTRMTNIKIKIQSSRGTEDGNRSIFQNAVLFGIRDVGPSPETQ